MKKSIYWVFATLAMLAMTACGGKNEKSETTEESGQVVETSATPDYDGINALDAKAEELTASDYDFLLDQAEILTDMAIKMGKEDYQKFVENLSEEKMGAVFKLGAGLSASAKQGKLSDSQLKRFNELKEKDPTK